MRTRSHSTDARMHTIAQYMQGVPAGKRAQFDAVWSIVHAIAPYAEVGMRYGMPTLIYKRKPLIAIAAFKHHIGVFPFGSKHVDAVRDRLTHYETSKGGFKVKDGQTVSKTLLAKLIALRKKEIDATPSHMAGKYA